MLPIASVLQPMQNIAKHGTFLYDGTVLCDVCITYSDVRFGSGDEEDAPDLRDDMKVATYYVFFGSTTERGRYNAAGGGYSSLEEAIANVERRPGFGQSVTWDD